MSEKVSGSTPSQNLIDIEKAIAAKNPRLLKALPRFILNYIKRAIHQDEMNDAINRNRHLFHLDFVNAGLEEFRLNLQVQGEENIPEKGGVIMASNHPLGGLDGIAFMKVVGNHRKDIKFLVNDLLMAFKNLGSILVPVNKHGRNTSEYMDQIDKVYASDQCIMIFPAGLVSRRQTLGKIEDLVWKKSFITKAIKYEKNIVPVFIDAKNSNFFYNLAYWRKKLGIKANIEMFYLADEMYKQKGKTITFTFGKAIAWQTFTKDKTAEQWAGLVKQHVYALKSGDKSKLLPTI